MQEIPQFQVAEKIGRLVDERPMAIVGGFVLVGWALARILHGQRRYDNQYLAQTVFVFAGQNDPTQPRVDRQLPQSPAQSREPMLGVNCAELEQGLIAVAYRLGSRRIEKIDFT